jgi:RND superfamily putative drug exporter
MQQRNLAGRAGRWSARHRRKAILGWLAFVVISVLLGGALGMKEIASEDLGDGESKRADQILADAFPDQASEEVLLQGQGGIQADDPRFREGVRDVVRAVSGFDTVRNVQSPLEPGNASHISPDGRSALVTFDLLGDDDELEDNVTPVQEAVAGVQSDNPGLLIEEFGDASADKALSQAFEDDLRKAETLSLPITLVILVVAFGSLAAAGVPLVLAISAVAAALGLVGVFSQVVPVDQSISSVILLIGLAVGVDYSLFYLLAPSGGFHVRTGRARLGPHRDHCHGRHVHHRQRYVHFVRHRHDHRGRDRGARLADRTAGGAVEARRSCRVGSRPVQAPHE